MIKITHEQFVELRRGRVPVISCGAGRAVEGAPGSKAPVRAGRVYALRVPRAKEAPARVIRALAIAVTVVDGEWFATFRADYEEQPPIFLAARPGSQRADYTLDAARALEDEPEVMPENANELARRLREEQRYNARPDRRPWSRNG